MYSPSSIEICGIFSLMWYIEPQPTSSITINRGGIPAGEQVMTHYVDWGFIMLGIGVFTFLVVKSYSN